MTPEENLEDPSSTEQTDEPSSGSKPEEQLQALLEAAKTTRLSPADEDRAVELVKETIAGGPKALAASLEALLSLPWSSGVKAVAEAWPETKPAGRARLLAALAKADSDVSRRIRLSLARGLHAQDPSASLKLITGVCEAMGGAQGGSSTKDRQIFANVMLGKARPWLMNIAMAEMKPAEAQKLITPALESCHQAPIFTQIWVLRWICDADKFESLPPEHIESIAKSISRWQPRWQKELRKIIPKLPDSLEAALAHFAGRPSAPAPAPVRAAESTAGGEAPAAPPLDADDEEEDEERFESAAEEARPPAPAPAQSPLRSEQEHRSSRDRPQPGPGPFDLNRSLREIESYVARLRSELQQAQAAARRREPAPERHRGRSQGPAASAEELEDLRRHNHQIEEQNEELRRRIDELTGDHEDRAATLEISDSLEQFKTFLGLKLKEDFADYTAISRESLNEVVRRHAHEILGRVFSVLQGEGVRFDREG
jgi:DNA-binding transcriptional MerR regulator